MGEVTPSTLDENPCTSAATGTGSEKRFSDKHISALQKVLQWPNKTNRTFKRNTERIPFVITCTAWKAIFPDKQNKKKEGELAKLERKKELKKN
jgi:hypothetical protein